MREPGFVYALINPSMSGLVKVGRTADDPAGRADELSSATGVPTAFVLAYKRFFSDSEAAERFVHAFLERRGYRVSANREFFRAPVAEVVDAILQAPGATTEGRQESPHAEAPVSHQPDEFLDTLTVTDRPAWEGVLQEAEDHYYGHGSVLQDYEEALKLYKVAANLGAVEAYVCLGKMYRDGEGCVKNNSTALAYFKEGARRGDLNCYAEMAELFGEAGHSENYQKCWDRYFASPPADTVGFYAYRYFETCRKKNRPVSHVDELRKHFAELLRSAEKFCSLVRGDPHSTLSLRSYYEAMEAEIRHHFGPRGDQVPANREFFQAPSEEVVDAILQAPGATTEGRQESPHAKGPVSHQPDESPDTLTVTDAPPWKPVLEEALARFLGSGTVIEDHEEALKLYNQAASLGAVQAYARLGMMHRWGKGCVKSYSKALGYFKEGARRGDVNCYAEMGELYGEVGHLEKFQKCWDRYFASPPADTVGLYAYRYFEACRKNNWPVSNADELRKHFSEVLRNAVAIGSHFASHGRASSKKSDYEEIEAEIKRRFGPAR